MTTAAKHSFSFRKQMLQLQHIEYRSYLNHENATIKTIDVGDSAFSDHWGGSDRGREDAVTEHKAIVT